ncbi:MAG: hypothetical protein JRD89_13720 [Deltaproteobacteria bacterium]|nr:hypothetical protein [Deltaproteobacteria bacterium]
MGTRLSLLIAPKFLAALLGVAQEDIDRGFGLVDAYERTPDNGTDTYAAMVDDPVGAILSDYQRPFEYEGATYGGTLSFGKWGADRLWGILCIAGISMDPNVGSMDRAEERHIVDCVIDAVRVEDHRNLNWVVFADHCTGLSWG